MISAECVHICIKLKSDQQLIEIGDQNWSQNFVFFPCESFKDIQGKIVFISAKGHLL